MLKIAPCGRSHFAVWGATDGTSTAPGRHRCGGERLPRHVHVGGLPDRRHPRGVLVPRSWSSRRRVRRPSHTPNQAHSVPSWSPQSAASTVGLPPPGQASCAWAQSCRRASTACLPPAGTPPCLAY